MPRIPDITDLSVPNPTERSLTRHQATVFTRTVGQTSRALGWAAQDVIRVERHKNRIIYLLDFSDLYPLIWPETSRNPYHETVRSLFESDQLTFALPPGAIMELLNKLNEKGEKHEDERRALRELMSNPFIRGILRYFEAAGEEEVPEDLFRVATVNEVLDKIQAATANEGRLALLSALIESGRLASLTSVVGAENVRANKILLDELATELYIQRPQAPRVVNYIDAHNYATAFGLTERRAETFGEVFHLVTSSPIPFRVFSDKKWWDDPLFRMGPEFTHVSALVRHPAELLLPAQMAGRRAPLVKAMRRDLEVIHEAWSEALATSDLDANSVSVEPTDDYLASATRFFADYRKLVRPVHEILAGDEASARNRSEVTGTSDSDYGRSVSGARWFKGLFEGPESPLSEGDRIVNHRDVIGLFDRMGGALRKGIRQLPRREIGDLDPRGLVFDPPEPVLRHARADFGGWTVHEYEVLLRHTDGRERSLLNADVYPNYVSMWWKTSADIDDFVESLHLFRSGMARWMSDNALQDTPSVEPKAFSGIFVLSETSEYSEPLGHQEISKGRILGVVPDDEGPRSVRIALEWADLCYDVHPHFGLSRRAGIMTHRYAPGPIGKFVAATAAVAPPPIVAVEAVRLLFDSRHEDN